MGSVGVASKWDTTAGGIKVGYEKWDLNRGLQRRVYPVCGKTNNGNEK